ncbi:Hypothetical protein D9617_1g082960 [Elsinoe fawcettii]|nr:Hypothetical protein D9617_1g082960 [Elsinoe fawcettii]
MKLSLAITPLLAAAGLANPVASNTTTTTTSATAIPTRLPTGSRSNITSGWLDDWSFGCRIEEVRQISDYDFDRFRITGSALYWANLTSSVKLFGVKLEENCAIVYKYPRPPRSPYKSYVGRKADLRLKMYGKLNVGSKPCLEKTLKSFGITKKCIQGEWY